MILAAKRQRAMYASMGDRQRVADLTRYVNWLVTR